VNRRLRAGLPRRPAAAPGASLVRDGKEVGRLTVRAYGGARRPRSGSSVASTGKSAPSCAFEHGHAVTIARVASAPLA
jgi:hypothetical protein